MTTFQDYINLYGDDMNVDILVSIASKNSKAKRLLIVFNVDKHSTLIEDADFISESQKKEQHWSQLYELVQSRKEEQDLDAIAFVEKGKITVGMYKLH